MGEFKWSSSQGTLLLVALPSGHVISHTTFVRGNEESEQNARNEITKTRDRWATNAPERYPSMDIREVERPRSIPRVPNKKPQEKVNAEEGTVLRRPVGEIDTPLLDGGGVVPTQEGRRAS